MLGSVMGDLLNEIEWYVRSGPDGDGAVALNHADRPVTFRGVELAPCESRVEL